MNNGKFKKGQRPWNYGLKGMGICKAPSNCIKKGQRLSKNTEFKKGRIPWNSGIEYDAIKNDKHHNWKGDDVGYNALHTWIKRNLESPKKCEKCGSNKSKWYHWHNINGNYDRNINNWEYLCAKCHIHIHKPWEARWGQY